MLRKQGKGMVDRLLLVTFMLPVCQLIPYWGQRAPRMVVKLALPWDSDILHPSSMLCDLMYVICYVILSTFCFSGLCFIFYIKAILGNLLRSVPAQPTIL